MASVRQRLRSWQVTVRVDADNGEETAQSSDLFPVVMLLITVVLALIGVVVLVAARS